VLLEIDRSKVPRKVVDENLDGGSDLFPHIYGPLPLDAVVTVHDPVWPGRSLPPPASPRRRDRVSRREARRFHQAALPSAGGDHILSGHSPPDPALGFTSTSLQVLYNNVETGWVDSAPHAHREADEIFIVLRGRLVVDVDGAQRVVGPREFCCFPRGVFHSIVRVDAPAETLMIRAPSVNDKVYQEPGHRHDKAEPTTARQPDE
jgi:mannose-6-phosphate isomerase-like protein (cupin superfamily)